MSVGLGSVGLGWWGRALATSAQSVGINIVAAFARSEDSRASFAEDYGCRAADSLDDLLNDPEVEGILVATSHGSHREIVEAAAAAGKHMLVEKPLTLNVEDARACIAAAEAAGVALQVGHQRRRTTANRRINEMVVAGELGDLQAFESQHSMPNGFKMPAEAWRWDTSQAPLGSITSLGIHKIDTMLYHGGPITRVSAMTRPGRERPIDEVSVLALEFASGALGTHITSFFLPMTSRMGVYGTKGAAVSERDGATLTFQGLNDPAPQPVDIEPNDPVADQLVEFAAVVRGEKTPEVDGRAGMAVIAVFEAAVESAATGQPVDVAVD